MLDLISEAEDRENEIDYQNEIIDPRLMVKAAKL